MKAIAVTQRVDVFPERGEIRDGLDQRLVSFLLRAGYLSFPVPNDFGVASFNGKQISKGLAVWLKSLSPQAIVLSGGNDVGQCAARDMTESHLIDYAQINRLPILGICRGMQMLAHWSGTILHPIAGHVRTRHKLIGEITHEVNSYHNYTLSECPEGFKILAYSENGEIEAIRHQNLPWEGWMWHPEREQEFNVNDIERLRILFQ